MRRTLPICAALVLTACTWWPFGAAKPPEPPPVDKTTPAKLGEWLKLVRWQIDLTAEVAYRDPDPAKRRAFIDLHAERVAVYAILRTHEQDPDAVASAGEAAQATLRRLRVQRSPEAKAFCDADPKNGVCSPLK